MEVYPLRSGIRYVSIRSRVSELRNQLPRDTVFQLWRHAAHFEVGDGGSHTSWLVIRSTQLLPSTTCSRMKLVEPLAICVPATTPSTSPAFSLPDLSNSCSAVRSISSAPRTWSRRTGCTPQSRFKIGRASCRERG